MIDGKPTLAFEASGTREAQQFCQESWLLNDLSILTSAGDRLRTAKSKLSVRLASPDEATGDEACDVLGAARTLADDG